MNHEPRHCEERSDEAIQCSFFALIPQPENQEKALDCFAALAMTLDVDHLARGWLADQNPE